MLVRFFRRDFVDLIAKSRTLLKNSGVVLFGDTSYLNRRLLNALNDRDEVESAWLTGTTVYMKLKAHGPDGKKIIVKVTDDIDVIIKKNLRNTTVAPEAPTSTPSLNSTLVPKKTDVADPATEIEEKINDSTSTIENKTMANGDVTDPKTVATSIE
jgi:hypothetical protein